VLAGVREYCEERERMRERERERKRERENGQPPKWRWGIQRQRWGTSKCCYRSESRAECNHNKAIKLSS
jgi:hypothetical protein